MANYVTCVNKDMTLEQLASALLTKTEDGEIAIRTMIVDACDENAIDCTTNSIPLTVNIARAIGINSCGKPALRLGMTPESLANALNLVSYADETAANTALAAGLLYYNQALSAIMITTA